LDDALYLIAVTQSNWSFATPHDGIYKQLFAHPQWWRTLLRGFVHEDWGLTSILAALEKTTGQYVSEQLAQRISRRRCLKQSYKNNI